MCRQSSKTTTQGLWPRVLTAKTRSIEGCPSPSEKSRKAMRRSGTCIKGHTAEGRNGLNTMRTVYSAGDLRTEHQALFFW